MLFSSTLFIYYFLALLFVIYFIIPSKYKNLVLLVFSMVFYFLGEPKYIIVLILSCIINYYISKQIYNKKSKFLLGIAITYNVGQLLVFKYTDFFISNVNNLFNIDMPLLYIVMPIGISFFTFQALSYVIDVYNGRHKPAKDVATFATYLTLFPQLIAGPIVRYSDVEQEMNGRTHSFSNFSEGVKRFVIGLSKKVLLANVIGEFTKSFVTSTVLASWLKPIGYTLQIYFDFSGYSDMAIGLGLMFGFHFLENFNYPLIASSITDFWRRWHISLSSWFRDYIYIPLGGNRVKFIKWIRNIFVVWFLTGFWHGASWNFILWGVYFGVILVIEKLLLKKHLDKTYVTKHIYSLVIIVVSFLIFNATSLAEIGSELKNMFGLSGISFANKETLYYIKDYLLVLIIACVAATPLFKTVISKLRNTRFSIVINVLEPVVLIVLLVVCTAFLVDESFNPFLYFRF